LLSVARRDSNVCMPVAVYLRVSTEEQKERQSIQTQREFAERYCEQHNLSAFHVYADDGVSGTLPLLSRPEGRQILPDARLRRFDQLLVYKLDRLGRETRLTLDAVAELESCGVRIKSMTEEFDTATASGRLMLTLLSGFAAHERDVIRERSLAGSQRVAEAGGWLGGHVAFGYRKDSSGGKIRLALSEEPIAGIGISEAEVVRTIFRRAGVERQSCRCIAEELNRSGVPCAYGGDGRLGQTPTSRLWHAGRVRNLLVNAMYKGQHQYGKRSRNLQRQLISRAVPPIVSEQLWQQAQETLHHHFRFGPRNCRHPYLLRGLIKCGLCRLNFIGTTVHSRGGRQDAYYRCNGKHDTRGVHGAGGKRCPSKDMRTDVLERVVWAEVEGLLRQPEILLERLRQRLAAERRDTERTRAEMAGLQASLDERERERDRVIALYRKGRIEEDVLERQMQEIEAEVAELRREIETLAGRLEAVDSGAAQLEAAAAVLEKLGARLQEPVDWQLQRELIEHLVQQVRVDTVEQDGKRTASITMMYRLAPITDDAMESSPCSGMVQHTLTLPDGHGNGVIDPRHNRPTFQIDGENHIVVGTVPEGADTLGSVQERFSSAVELAALAAGWPAQRLVHIWNVLPEVLPVKRFENREVGVHRIWKRLQTGSAPEKPPAEMPAPVEAHAPESAPVPASTVEKATVTPTAAKVLEPIIEARVGSRAEAVLSLLRRTEGATIAQLMQTTGWQAHSIRGFLSGIVGKKMGLKLASRKPAGGSRVYQIQT